MNILVPKHIPWEQFTPIEKDDVAVIAHVLYLSHERRKINNDLRRTNRYWYRIEIGSRRWYKLIGRRYAKLLNRLQELGVIRRPKSYSNGKNGFKKKVWLAPKYREDFETYELPDWMAQKLIDDGERRFNDKCATLPTITRTPIDTYKRLNASIQRLGISITDEELSKLRRYVQKDTNGKVIRRFRPYDNVVVRQLLDNNYLTCTPGGNGARFYSPANQSIREIRPFLTADREHPLVNLDVQCSQPTMLLLACRNHHAPNLPSDLRQLLDYVNRGGDLYELWGKAIGIDDRGDFKSSVLWESLFGPIKDADLLYGLFERDYPTLAQYVWDTKGGQSLKKKDYGRLSVECQLAESDFIIGKVCTRIFDAKPDTFVVTIHDSLLVKPQDRAWIGDIMRDEFRKLDMTPTITETRYDRAG